MTSKIFLTLVVAAWGGVVLTGCAGRTLTPFAPQPAADDFRVVIQRAQEKVFPALVFLKPVKQQLAGGERQRQVVFGSGVIISPDGLVVTNSHVAKDAAEIKCVLFNREQFSARIVGVDEDTDLALVKLQLPPNHPPLPVVAFADSDRVKEGQFVMALGSPLGFTRSISFGVISCSRRYLEVGAYNLWIQTDAAINPGNSGGPLVDDQGAVVGINTLRASWGDNIGFAIPANVVKSVVASLREHRRVVRSYCGIQLQAVKDFMSNTVLDYDRGVVVGGVDENSPAEAAGLRAGDVILMCDDAPVNGMYLEDLPGIRARLAALPAEKPVWLTVRRDKDALAVKIVPIIKQAPQTEGIELEAWNCSAQEISKFRTPTLAYFNPKGVFILGVRRPGNAFASGIRSGDVVLSVDGQPVPDLPALKALYDRLVGLERGRRTALFEMMRAGHRYYTVLDFNADYKAIK